MLFILRIALVLALTAGCALAASAETRIALVIANSNYTNTTRLPNAANDAKAVAAMLARVNFQVEPVRADLTQAQMLQVLNAFAAKARTADVALIYYAGHGVEIGGVNYLIPKDASFRTPDDVDFGAVPVDLVMKAAQGAKRLKIVILDSCRDNPFLSKWDLRGSTRSVGTRGLAPVEPAGETLVAYAAKAGSTAADGPANGNSPFAAALVKFIPQPGVEFRLMFGKVRDEVLSITRGRQEPFIYGSLGGREFYFVPGKPGVASGPRTAAEWAQRINEVNKDTPLARMVFLFGLPVGNHPAPQKLQGARASVRAKTFPAGPWTLLWIGDEYGSYAVIVAQNSNHANGPMAKQAQAIRLPLLGALDEVDVSKIDFAWVQNCSSDDAHGAAELKGRPFWIVSGECEFRREFDRYDINYYAFAFEHGADWRSGDKPACLQEMDEGVKFGALCGSSWRRYPGAYIVYWDKRELASETLRDFVDAFFGPS